MTELTDIHCHVLPQVDDGSKNMETSIEMLRQMYDEGIRRVIVTPHYHKGHMDADIDTVRSRFHELEEACGADPKTAGIELYLGCELYYYPSAISWLQEGVISTMAGSDYVLTEFAFTLDKHSIEDGITNLINAGYLPIIAHIERYENLVGDLDFVSGLIEKGAYVQINSEALDAPYKVRKFAKKLLKNHMVHFVATDAHGVHHRTPKLAAAAQYIAKHYGEEYCTRLFSENPSRILENEYVSS